MKSIVALVIVILAAVVLIPGSMYTVSEGWQAVITQFGDPVRVRTQAGLYFKPPFIQDVHRLEKRLLPWDGDPENMQTLDKKRIFIDVWARWRIVDPMKFFQAVRTETRGYKILDDLVDSAVRDVVARNNLIEVVRSSNRELLYESDELARDAASSQDRITVGRATMEAEILTVASVGLKEQYGMELSVVHIKRVNYIESVRTTVYDRMKSERIRIAKLFESEAEEEKNRILGLTTKELDGIKGEQQQRSAEIRGRAKAEVIRIAAEAYGESPEFYGFLRHLETYKKTLGAGTRLVLSTDNELLRYLRGSTVGSDEATRVQQEEKPEGSTEEEQALLQGQSDARGHTGESYGAAPAALVVVFTLLEPSTTKAVPTERMEANNKFAVRTGSVSGNHDLRYCSNALLQGQSVSRSVSIADHLGKLG